MSFLVWFILICVCLLFVFKFLNKFKFAKVGSMVLVSGGVKTGKSTFSVYLVQREYKKRLRQVRFKNFFLRLFGKKLIEKPLIYSNVPLSIPYVPLTYELLTRKERFVYNSVIYVQEASLVSDSQMIRNQDYNEQSLLFNKLIGHETKGGVVIYDTQSISDCHYSIKRCLSTYFYVHSVIKWIPFFLVMNVQECRYSEDNSTINVSNEDVENTLKKVLIPKSVWKKFDCYCYSSLTDNLPVARGIVKSKSLKCTYVLSFRERFNNLKVDKK